MDRQKLITVLVAVALVVAALWIWRRWNRGSIPAKDQKFSEPKVQSVADVIKDLEQGQKTVTT